MENEQCRLCVAIGSLTPSGKLAERRNEALFTVDVTGDAASESILWGCSIPPLLHSALVHRGVRGARRFRIESDLNPGGETATSERMCARRWPEASSASRCAKFRRRCIPQALHSPP